MDPEAPLKSTKDPVLKRQIELKIDALFPHDNFFFYNANGEFQEEEENEIKRLISHCM